MVKSKMARGGKGKKAWPVIYAFGCYLMSPPQTIFIPPTRAPTPHPLRPLTAKTLPTTRWRSWRRWRKDAVGCGASSFPPANSAADSPTTRSSGQRRASASVAAMPRHTSIVADGSARQAGDTSATGATVRETAPVVVLGSGTYAGARACATTAMRHNDLVDNNGEWFHINMPADVTNPVISAMDADWASFFTVPKVPNEAGARSRRETRALYRTLPNPLFTPPSASPPQHHKW